MAEDDGVLKGVQNGVTVIAEIMKAAGDNSEVKEAGRNLGQAALTLTKSINVVLLPLAAMNFGVEKARRYFENDFEEDVAKKMAAIPIDKLVEPNASLAGPALQGLAFSFEEADLKEMYLNLLSTAMDSRVSSKAHPAFVEVIKQITASEAEHLKTIFSVPDNFPVCQVRRAVEGGYQTLYMHLMDNVDLKSGQPIVDEDLPALVDNWIRLGLVVVDYSRAISKAGAYDWAKERPEFQVLQIGFKDAIFLENGILHVTSFGSNFARAVGLHHSYLLK
jgi:hypothetical protein